MSIINNHAQTLKFFCGIFNFLLEIWIFFPKISEFIQGVSQFSVKGDKESKLRFAFRIYDMDNDGFISNGELFQVLKMMVGNNLKDAQLQQIVDKTILFADKDEDGKINFEEFCSVSTASIITMFPTFNI